MTVLRNGQLVGQFAAEIRQTTKMHAAYGLDRLGQEAARALVDKKLRSMQGLDHQVATRRLAGPGIGTSAQEHLFERFHRGRHVLSTNYGGLGLGLYITKQIVERHGGSIWVDSREGHGTTFFFSLPIAEEVSGEESEPTRAVART